MSNLAVAAMVNSAGSRTAHKILLFGVFCVGTKFRPRIGRLSWTAIPGLVLLLFLVGLPEMSYADQSALSRCIRSPEGPGTAECLSREHGRRSGDQTKLLRELEKELTACTITWSGYRTAEALQSLKNAQKQWLGFVNQECDYEYHTFGQGSLATTVNLQCEIDRYTERNSELSRKLKAVREVKKMLKEDLPTAIVCSP